MGTGTIPSNLSQRDHFILGRTLSGVSFSYTDLDEADFSYASVGFTIFGDVDLRRVKGLRYVKHDLPSTIGINALVRSQGEIPAIFLRKAGVPNTFIEYARSLVKNPIEYYTCFISYSSKDQAFAERLTDLPWAANMRRMRHIGDFTKWKNHDDYQKAFNRLLRDLKASEKNLLPIDD